MENFNTKVLLILFVISSFLCHAEKGLPNAERVIYAHYITDHFPEQLTNPAKEKRKSLSQFGYGLYYFAFPLFPVTEFIDPHDFGEQSYGKPGPKERNGSLYTCRGGFMDFSHIRAATDWTVYLTFMIITEGKDFDLEHEGGTLHLHFKNLDELSLDDITDMAQKIAFERLEWHEVASWHYHLPNYSMSEQQSTFTPEDTYSNFLGTEIGKRVALRMLRKQDGLTYSQIASDEIQKMVESLDPMNTKRASKKAYDIVDRDKQMKLPEAKRNTDIWWDSKILFRDERNVFKRYTNVGPKIGPWIVPMSEKVGCPAHPSTQVWDVPQTASTGKSFYDYYEFLITPDQTLFYSKETKKMLHEPFGAFLSKDMAYTIAHISLDMASHLGEGFDRRDHHDPVPQYKHLPTVWFK